MNNVKPWYTSKTIWGALVAMIAGIGSSVGFELGSQIQAELVETALKMVSTVGSMLAIYGRFAASNAIE